MPPADPSKKSGSLGKPKYSTFMCPPADPSKKSGSLGKADGFGAAAAAALEQQHTEPGQRSAENLSETSVAKPQGQSARATPVT